MPTRRRPRRPAAVAAAKVDPSVAPVAEIIGTFCERHLDAEYLRLCGKALFALSRSLPAGELGRGKPGAWAAGIIYAVGQHNFLGDPGSRPHLRSEAIPPGCGVSVATMHNRARVVRGALFAGGPLSGFEFFTKDRLREMDPIFQTMKTLEPSLLDAVGGATLEEIFDDDNLAADLPHRDNGKRTGKRLGSVGAPGAATLFGDTINLASLLPGSSKPTRRGGEFVDADRPAMSAYYDLQEEYAAPTGAANGPRRLTKPRSAALERELRGLLASDPDFYDPYLWLRDLLRRGNDGRETEAAELLETAYSRAVARVAPKGKWPARLEWGWLENRHILRTLLNHAIAAWEDGRTDDAAGEFARMLALNPNDNAGARNYLLALREGQTFAEHRARFEVNGLIRAEVFDWFEEHAPKYPADFAAWREAVGAEG